MVAFALSVPSMRVTAILGGVPMALAILVIALVGPETRRKSLEHITAEQLDGKLAPVPS